MHLACTLDQWSTSGVSLATGLTGCMVLLIREVKRRDWRRTDVPIDANVAVDLTGTEPERRQ